MVDLNITGRKSTMFLEIWRDGKSTIFSIFIVVWYSAELYAVYGRLTGDSQSFCFVDSVPYLGHFIFPI